MLDLSTGVGREPVQPAAGTPSALVPGPQPQPVSRRQLARAVRVMIGAFLVAAAWTLVTSSGAEAADDGSGRTLGGLTQSVDHGTQPILRLLGGAVAATADTARHPRAHPAAGRPTHPHAARTTHPHAARTTHPHAARTTHPNAARTTHPNATHPQAAQTNRQVTRLTTGVGQVLEATQTRVVPVVHPLVQPVLQPVLQPVGAALGVDPVALPLPLVTDVLSSATTLLGSPLLSGRPGLGELLPIGPGSGLASGPVPSAGVIARGGQPFAGLSAAPSGADAGAPPAAYRPGRSGLPTLPSLPSLPALPSLPIGSTSGPASASAAASGLLTLAAGGALIWFFGLPRAGRLATRRVRVPASLALRPSTRPA